MNALAEKYGDKVAILGYPCNQFGHQTNEDNAEFLNTLKYVRPGGNFDRIASTLCRSQGRSARLARRRLHCFRRGGRRYGGRRGCRRFRRLGRRRIAIDGPVIDQFIDSHLDMPPERLKR